ncbi:DUF4192 family protein [Streptomyces sp. NPDC054784]
MSTGAANDLPAERQLWGHLARRRVPSHTEKAPPLLTLLGWVAWRQNDTVTASHTFSDALDNDPHDPGCLCVPHTLIHQLKVDPAFFRQSTYTPVDRAVPDLEFHRIP